MERCGTWEVKLRGERLRDTQIFTGDETDQSPFNDGWEDVTLPTMTLGKVRAWTESQAISQAATAFGYPANCLIAEPCWSPVDALEKALFTAILDEVGLPAQKLADRYYEMAWTFGSMLLAIEGAYAIVEIVEREGPRAGEALLTCTLEQFRDAVTSQARDTALSVFEEK